MTTKDLAVDAIQDFQKVVRCNLADISPDMRAHLVFQWHPETEATAQRENDFTFFKLDHATDRVTAAGIPFEKNSFMLPGTVHLVLKSVSTS